MENKFYGHVFQIRNSPDRKLFPEFSAFDLMVKEEEPGWIWTDEGYIWSPPSGNMHEFMGSVSTSDHTGIGDRVEEFYLYSRQLDVDGDAIPPATAFSTAFRRTFRPIRRDFMRNSLRRNRSQTIIIQPKKAKPCDISIGNLLIQKIMRKENDWMINIIYN